ncbi:MAG TPA: hypothetical protein V6C97_22845 [Oculatellaceae cyanobacterium]
MLQQATSEFKEYLASRLRRIDEWQAKDNIARINEINFATDDEVIRRWLWLASITGAPLAFLVMPLLISVLQPFLWPQLAAGLWIMAKVMMAIVFVIFVGTTLYTLKASN